MGALVAARLAAGIVALVSPGGARHRASPPAAQAASRPNVVLVLTDDLSMNLVRFMPHVLAMERNGLTFEDYFVADSLCCPSRASIFTGDFPHDAGVFSNFGPGGGFAPTTSTVTSATRSRSPCSARATRPR